MTPDDHRAPTTLMVVDDSPEFLASAGAMLAEEGFEVVSCVSDPLRVVPEVERLRPEVVLVDIQMPVVDGFQIAGLLAALDSPPIVVLISSRDASTYGSTLRAAPVRGFIAKWELSGYALASLV